MTVDARPEENVMTAIRNLTLGLRTERHISAEFEPCLSIASLCLGRRLFNRRTIMFRISRTVITLLFSLSLLSPVFAQTRRSNAQTPGPIVTATTSNGRVRYASLGEVNQTRLQVFSQEGAQVFDSGYRLGNLIDWPLSDQQGQHLADGSYLFLITVRDFSALLTQKYGTALLENDQVALQQIGRDELLPAQAVALQANKLSEVLSPVDRIGAVGPGGPITAANDGGVVVDIVPSGKQKTVTTSQPTPGGENIAGTGVQNKIAKWTDNAGTLGDSGIFETNSNVGIGTISPATALDVGNGGEVRSTGGTVQTFMQSSTGNGGYIGTRSNHYFIIRTNNVDVMTLLPGGNVGIGTASPGAKLDVNGNLYIHNTNGSVTHFDYAGSNTNYLRGINIFDGGPAYFTGGNVGIGTNNPAAKLDVSGDVNVTGNAMISGNIAAKYQDVAEWVQARQRMAPGTVVSLDSTRSNAVTPSRRAYDALIAGVVSAQPWVILGEAGAGKVMVATSGRVMVKVDASKYPVRIGDLLVTSNRPGVAMRSRPIRVAGKLIHRPGTIIGKALEALPNGAGEILVLVSLQ